MKVVTLHPDTYSSYRIQALDCDLVLVSPWVDPATIYTKEFDGWEEFEDWAGLFFKSVERLKEGR